MSARRLIVNADDFGLTTGVNRAIAQLAEAGAVTSATLMATGAAFDDAVAHAHRLPQLGVGCHVVLTDGVPVSHPSQIPTLLGADGKTFRTSLTEFWLAALRGVIHGDDIVREAAAQVQRLQRAGLDVTHIDTHKHTHILPQVAGPLLHVAERAGISAVRNPFEPAWAAVLKHASPLRALEVRLTRWLGPKWHALPQIRSGTLHTTDGTVGISATGGLNRTTLMQILKAMPAGTWELVTHPGYNDSSLSHIQTRLRASREIELDALLTLLARDPEPLTSQQCPDFEHPFTPQLIHYGVLGTAGVLRSIGQFVPATGHEPIT